MTSERRPKKSGVWARHPDDWYVEPHWCSQRLFETERFDGRIYDPACGLGRVVQSAKAAGFEAVGSDLKYRSSHCSMVCDFLAPSEATYDNIVSNPPFKDAQRFAEKALQRAAHKVAFLLPTIWLHGDKRSRWLTQTPLATIYLLTPRPSMPPGTVIEAGIDPSNGTKDFAWLVWDHLAGEAPPAIKWLRRKA